MTRPPRVGSDTRDRIRAVALSVLMVLSIVSGIPLASDVAVADSGSSDLVVESTDPDWPEFGDGMTNDGNNSESGGPGDIAGLDWRIQTNTSNIYSSPVVVNGTLYQGTENGLYAFNTSDGTEVWHNTSIDLKNDQDTGSLDRVDSPAYHDGYLYIGTADGTNSSLLKIDASDGSVEWSFDDPESDFMGGATTVYNGSVYAAEHDNTLWKVNASTGDQEANFTGTSTNIQSEPAVVDGHVYLGDSSGTLFKLDADDLMENWSTSVTGAIVSGPTVVNRTVYFGTTDGNLYARDAGLDPNSGDRVWDKTSVFSNDIRAAPAVADGKLFVGSMDNIFRAFDVSDGSELWSYDAGDSITASPAYVDGTVYVGDYEGDVFALNASTGNLNWEFLVYGAPNGIKSSPAVVNGSVYFGDYSGDVYKLKTPESGLPVSEDFDESTEPAEWELRGDAAWNADLGGQKTLQLTTADPNQFGAALYDRPFSSESGAVTEFDYYADDGTATGADGLSFFLVDGSRVHRSSDSISGDSGGALGYAAATTADGVPNGYLGVGFDEFGNFDADGYSGSEGGEQEVTLRGTQASDYGLIAMTDVNGEFGQNVDGGWRRARITTEAIDASGDGNPDATSIRVEMSWDGGQTWETVTDTAYSEVPPADLKLGFAGATGGSTNVHAIDNLSVREPTDLSLAVIDSSDGGVAGDSTEFTYEVRNEGPNANDQITVTDDVTTGAGGLENYEWSYVTDGASDSGSGSGTLVGMSLVDG